MMEPTTIGGRLRKRRRELDLTQDELARRVGLSRGHLANIEADREPLGRNALIRLARELELSLDALTAGAA